MAYVPKKKELKINYKIVIPLAAVLLLMVYAIVLKYSTNNNETRTICGFDEEQMKTALQQNYSDTYQVSDYLYYGESLDLYAQPYDLENSDELTGKTVEVVNMCTKEEYSFIMEANVDRQLTLYSLPEGYYEVFVIDNLVRKRIVYNGELEENEFMLVPRNGTQRRVELRNDPLYFNANEITIPDKYLFLDITEEAIRNDIDVLLDPYGMNADVTYLPDKGVEGNDILENDAMYEAAVLLKEELEKYGLRVDITKNHKEEAINAYGIDGRLNKGYKQNAKYYILMRMNVSPYENVRGMEIYHSRYAASSIEKSIMYSLKKDLDVYANNIISYNPDNPGIGTTAFIEGIDGRKVYENHLFLRESGGRATGAGMYSKSSQEMNASFAKDGNGMKGMEIDFGYVSNKEDAAFWKEHKEEIIQSVASSFVKSIHAEN